MGESINHIRHGCRVVRFMAYGAHDHIVLPMGNIMTWHLNEREGDATMIARQTHIRYHAVIWTGPDYEQSGRPDARFISVLDRLCPDPEVAILTMTKFGDSRRDNTVILRGSMLAAEALNLEEFDWAPPA